MSYNQYQFPIQSIGSPPPSKLQEHYTLFMRLFHHRTKSLPKPVVSDTLLKAILIHLAHLQIFLDMPKRTPSKITFDPIQHLKKLQETLSISQSSYIKSLEKITNIIDKAYLLEPQIETLVWILYQSIGNTLITPTELKLGILAVYETFKLQYETKPYHQTDSFPDELSTTPITQIQNFSNLNITSDSNPFITNPRLVKAACTFVFYQNFAHQHNLKKTIPLSTLANICLLPNPFSISQFANFIVSICPEFSVFQQITRSNNLDVSDNSDDDFEHVHKDNLDINRHNPSNTKTSESSDLPNTFPWSCVSCVSCVSNDPNILSPDIKKGLLSIINHSKSPKSPINLNHPVHIQSINNLKEYSKWKLNAIRMSQSK